MKQKQQASGAGGGDQHTATEPGPATTYELPLHAPRLGAHPISRPNIAGEAALPQRSTWSI